MMFKLPLLNINNQIPRNNSLSYLKQPATAKMSYQQNNAKQFRTIQKSRHFYNKIDTISSVQHPSDGLEDSQRIQQIKTAHLNKIRDFLNQLGMLVSYYRSIEKDDVTCKKNLFSWFHQSQKIFLNSLRPQPNQSKLIKNAMQLKISTIEPLSSQMKSLPLKKQNHPQKPYLQVNILKAQIEEYKKDNSQCMERIEQIYELLQALKDKYQSQKKRNQGLDLAISSYSHHIDCLLTKLSKKSQTEQGLTQMEKEIQKIIVILKFKTFDSHQKY